MLFKIGWRSFFHQIRNYMVYLICMMVAVMIFYSFSALSYDQSLIRRVQQDVQIESILMIGNIIVASIVLFFMLNANRFFLRQRQKEIGVYQLLGLRKKRILFQILSETLLLNFFSLASGIFMGIIFSKFFSMILIRLMDLNISSRFFLSWAPVRTTIVVFLLALLFISFQIIFFMRRKSGVDLFQLKNPFTQEKMRLRPLRYFLGLAGIVIIGTGFSFAFFLRKILLSYIRTTQDYSIVLWLPLLILCLCIIGTYLFFHDTLPLILFYRSKGKKRMLAGDKMLAYSSIRGSYQKSWRSFSFLTIVVALVIALIGGTIGTLALNNQNVNRNSPVDFQITAEQKDQLENLIVKNNGQVTQQTTVKFKAAAASVKTKLFYDKGYQEHYGSFVNIISMTDYTALQAMISEMPSLKLQNSEAVLFDNSYMVLRQFSTYAPEITLQETKALKLKAVYPNFFGDNSLRYLLNNTMLVTDKQYESMTGVNYKISYVNAKGYDQKQLEEDISKTLPGDWIAPVSTYSDTKNDQSVPKIEEGTFTEQQNPDLGINLSRFSQAIHYPNWRSAQRLSGIYLFVSFFIGIIVLITTSCALILRQFANTENEKESYLLLYRLGMTKGEIRKIIYQQNFWLFMPVSILAVLHATFAIHALTQFINTDAYKFAYLFAGAIILGYFCACLLTVRLCLRIIEE